MTSVSVQKDILPLLLEIPGLTEIGPLLPVLLGKLKYFFISLEG